MSIPSVLKKIIATKHDEIAAGRYRTPRAELRSRAGDAAPTRGFAAALNSCMARGTAVIAEVKKASPSAGVIRADFRPDDIARAYKEGGAACLSVLTDTLYFQGHLDDLGTARNACELPVLRKDFIVDPWQLLQSRCAGADCILLIVAALGHSQLQDLCGEALEWGLDVLVEVHDEAEMETALTLGDVCLLGVNNRNLHDFTTDLAISERLRELLPDERALITESGIRAPADVARMRAAGIHAFLVGEAFMREEDPGEALRELFAA